MSLRTAGMLKSLSKHIKYYISFTFKLFNMPCKLFAKRAKNVQELNLGYRGFKAKTS